MSIKLYEIGLLTEVDGAALAAYCQCYKRWLEAEEFLDKYSHDKECNFNGLMFKTPQGYMQQLPQVSIAQTYAKLMSVYLGKFGLSPADRVGMIAPKSPEKTGKFSKTLSG
jgi:P27 family predicted phage terminase small subunit